MRALLKDPLTHFLAAGALLFIIGSATKPPAPDDERIIVDRPALLEFIQYRSRAFEPRAAAALLDGMNDKARADLVREFVREEAMAREAKSLGLDANDYVIRQRMVQKVEFLAEAAADAALPTDAEIEDYYAAHPERYTSPPAATLTHVFLSTEKRPAELARAEAVRLLNQLQVTNAGFNDATAYGDRFLFHKNYVDRTDEYIASQLGDEIRNAVFSGAAPTGRWVGPYRSDYGFHLIYVAAVTSARLPRLDEIRDVVASDLTADMKQIAIDTSIDAIVAKYKIDIRTGDGG